MDGRIPQGVRGLKLGSHVVTKEHIRRIPQGVRGLKYGVRRYLLCEAVSHPARGAWIEIYRV